MRRARHGDARHRRADERGAAAVEFALVMPLLLLLVFGIITFGYMLSFRQAISQAAAEGARAAAVAPASIANADRQARAVDAINDALGSFDVTCAGAGLNHAGDPAGTCTVSEPASCTSGDEGQCVVVTLDYTYADDPLLPAPLMDPFLPDHLRYVTEVRVS